MNDPRQVWTDEKILEKLKEMIDCTKQKSMPTHSEIFDFFGDYKLTNAIRRHGGTKKFADILGVEIKKYESFIGDTYECLCIEYLINSFSLECDKMVPRYPYDILVEKCLKLDVKAGRKVLTKDAFYYTFNIEKSCQTCDVYVCYCLNDDMSINKTYIIPSHILSGKNQLSLGISKSKYDIYLDRWDIIPKYIELLKSLDQSKSQV